MDINEDRERKRRKIAEVVERMRGREEAFERDRSQRLAAALNAPAGEPMSVEEGLAEMRAFDEAGNSRKS